MNFELKKSPAQEDIEYLQEKLEQIHLDLYRNVEKHTLTDSLQEAAKAEPEFFKIAIQESLALLKDAHTRVTEEFRQEELFPVRYLEIDGCFYIIGAETKDSPLLGQQLLRINGTLVEEILPSLSKLSSKENHEVLMRDLAWFLESNKILRRYGFSKADTISITTDKGDTTLQVSNSERFLYRMNPLIWDKKDILGNTTYEGNSLYQFKMEDGNLIFQYNNCSNNDFSEEYLEEFKSHLLRRAIDARNIVVDLRLNDGGSTEIMKDLFERLPDNKSIYVAIGRRTFSAAMHHLLYLKQKKGAILIGDNAGQRPNRFGDHKEIVLPNSQIQIACSYKYFELLPGQDIDVIEPDTRIPITIEDYKNNRDPLNQWIKDNL